MPLIPTMRSVGTSFPFAGNPGSVCETIAPFSMTLTFLPKARSATAAATCFDVRISSSFT